MLKHHKYVIESAKKRIYVKADFTGPHMHLPRLFTIWCNKMRNLAYFASTIHFDWKLLTKQQVEKNTSIHMTFSYIREPFFFAILRRIHRTFHCVLCTNIFTCSASIYALRTCPTCLSVPITPMQVSGGGDELELQLESSISTNCVTNKIFFEPALRVLFIRKSEGIVKKACDTCTWVVWNLTWKKLTSYRKLWRIFKK